MRSRSASRTWRSSAATPPATATSSWAATAVLVTIGWDGFGISEQIWTMIVILVAATITILILVTRRDYAYSAVIIWALIGIYIKRIADDPVYGMQSQIANTALIGIIIIIIIAILSFFQISKITIRRT